MTRPTVTRTGDTWMFVWAEAGFAIGLERVREKSGDVFAECVVGTRSNGANGHNGHLVRRSLNLLSSQTRGTFAKELVERSNQLVDEATWKNWLEFASETTIEQMRAGEPFLKLATIAPTLDPQYFVDHFLPLDETTILNGDGETGKSWFAIALAVAVLAGREILPGLRPLKAGRVLYLDWETGFAEVRRRQAWVEGGLGLLQPVDLIYRSMTRGIAEDVEIVRTRVVEDQIDLVIADSLGPATADDLESGSPAVRTMAAFRQLPCTRLCLAHQSKAVAQQQNGRGRTYGNIMFENQSRSVWEMRHEEGGNEVALFHRKANVGPHQPDLSYRQAWNDAAHTYRIEPVRLSDTPSLQKFGSLRTRLQAALRDGAKDLKVLADELQTDEHGLRTQINRWPEFTQVARGGGRSNTAVWGLKFKDEDGKLHDF